MSVSLYYGARRATPMTAPEKAEVDRVVATRQASFPYADEEGLFLYSRTGEPDEILAGSSKMPSDPERLLPVIDHLLNSVTALRQALPHTTWHVHLDDLDVPWDENHGYTLPGLHDPDL